MLVPYSWFQILWYFYIYGFLGWCSEAVSYTHLTLPTILRV